MSWADLTREDKARLKREARAQAVAKGMFRKAIYRPPVEQPQASPRPAEVYRSDYCVFGRHQLCGRALTCGCSCHRTVV